MLEALSEVEDKLYQPDSITQFLQKYNVPAVIKQLNKSKKSENKERIRRLLRKVSESPHYKDFLMCSVTHSKDEEQTMAKYLASEESDEYYLLILSKMEEVVGIMAHQKEIIPAMFKLIHYPNGIKMTKFFVKMYQQNNGADFLFSEHIHKELREGLGLSPAELQEVDTVVQMRFFELVSQIAKISETTCKFVEDLLKEALSIYKTEDILLKMNMVELLPVLAEGQHSSKIVRQHEIWTLIEKDACNPENEFYIRKYLTILMVEMFTQGQTELSPKLRKEIVSFLNGFILQKGEDLLAAIDLISHLFKSIEGTKIVMSNSVILNTYTKLSRYTEDQVKKSYLEGLIFLTSRHQNPAKKKLVINLCNCIGNPELSTELSHNVNADNFMVSALSDFAEWLANYLQLPFPEIEEKLVDLLANLLQFTQITKYLFENQKTTVYLLRPTNVNSGKVLRQKKTELITKILEKGENEWKETELAQYSRMLKKELQNHKMEMEIALDVE